MREITYIRSQTQKAMMNKKMRFSVWLITKLRNRRMTQREIMDEWQRSPANDDGDVPSRSTFERCKNDIMSTFGVDIGCDSRHAYYIESSLYDAEMTDWMLSAFRMVGLGARLKQRDKIMIEPAPRNSELLDAILYAVDNSRVLRFHYETPFGKAADYKIAPAFVRLFRQRWYLIGRYAYAPTVRIFAFDRMTNLEVMEERCRLTAEERKALIPDRFFRDCFGIIREEGKRAEKVRVRAFWPEACFLEETPLHPSQRLVTKTEAYADYEMTVQITRDLKQELLWHGRKLAVLAPESLRLEMLAILDGMHESYASGENYSDD